MVAQNRRLFANQRIQKLPQMSNIICGSPYFMRDFVFGTKTHFCSVHTEGRLVCVGLIL